MRLNVVYLLELLLSKRAQTVQLCDGVCAVEWVAGRWHCDTYCRLVVRQVQHVLGQEKHLLHHWLDNRDPIVFVHLYCADLDQ